MSCKEKPATVKLIKMVKGTVEELRLCQECAAQNSPYQKKVSQISLDSILAGLLAEHQKAEGAGHPAEGEDLTCPTCGLPFDSYRSSLLLGCSDCYTSFEKYLQADLRKFHGSIVHRGRTPESGPELEATPPALPPPPSTPAPRRSPAEVRRRMKEAVEAENYELAAKLRDELRELETPTTSNS
ncbi:MAG: UvrB/UvrC motif-containing protein [Candidatus Sumerlaeaceae bacterium]|nr:UvrB/UvrC motif-containing protein [Candidatus Sumerlaeaceae bacterium]